MTFDPFDFSDRYNTPLSPEQEAAFQLWDRAGDIYDYDARGAWLEMQRGLLEQAENGHLTDKYKKPNHPTFSDQSQYSGVDGFYGGTWYPLPGGSFVYWANPTNIYPPQELSDYFQNHERGNILMDTGVRW